MEPITEEQYHSALEHMPPALRDVLFFGGTSHALATIYSRNNFTVEQSFAVSALVGFILVGLVPVKNIIAHIQEKSGISPDIARRVAYDIRQEVFAPVARELAAIQPEALAAKRQEPSPLRSSFEAAREMRGYAPKTTPDTIVHVPHKMPPPYQSKRLLRDPNAETQNNSQDSKPETDQFLAEKIRNIIQKPGIPRMPRIKPNIPDDNVVNLRK